jgi:antitoxin (DNA-binding transcriptional repressor) of toxin-antitoxin stability system
MSEEMHEPTVVTRPLAQLTVTSTATITIGIGQFRGDTRNYVRRALAGETFKVMRRGRPIVELRAAHHAHDTGNARISLTLARTHASGFFDRVAAGEVIVIEHRGEAIAALHPCAG